MRKIIIISDILVVLLLGCTNNQSNKNETETIEGDVIINCIDSISPNGYCDKYCERFYSSGELMETYTTKDDSILDVSYKGYYKNGNLQDSTFYTAGAVYGIYKSFYPDGTKKRFCDYVIIGDGQYSYRNQLVEFDSLTEEVNKEKSFYYSFELPKNIKDEDSLIVNFYFNNPMYQDTSYLEFGNYDEFFRISKEDKEKTRIIPVINQKAEFKIKVEKRDYYFIRGIIYNFDKADTTKRRLFYFYEKYEVN